MRNYSIDKVEISWFGLDLKPGLAQGSSITETRTSSSWSVTPTGMGRVTRSYNPDRSGQLAFVIDQTSQVHKDLQVLAALDRQARNVVGVMTIKDTTSDETFYFKNAFIMTDPNMTRGTEAATFTWVFAFEEAEYAPGAANANVVGS
jgi:hypothetical protein